MHQPERYTKKREKGRETEKEKKIEREKEREREKEKKIRGCITPATAPLHIIAAHNSLRVFTEKPRGCRAR